MNSVLLDSDVLIVINAIKHYKVDDAIFWLDNYGLYFTFKSDIELFDFIY